MTVLGHEAVLSADFYQVRKKRAVFRRQYALQARHIALMAAIRADVSVIRLRLTVSARESQRHLP
jgi:hypothetical protein